RRRGRAARHGRRRGRRGRGKRAPFPQPRRGARRGVDEPVDGRDLGARGGARGGAAGPADGRVLAAIDAAAAREVIVLPNNPNAILAAEQAAAQAGRSARVLPTSSIPAGLAALVAYDGSQSADENAGAMAEALAAVTTGAVTVASRELAVDGVQVRKGAYLGLLEGEPMAAGDAFDQVAERVVERLLAEPRTVLTVLTGE